MNGKRFLLCAVVFALAASMSSFGDDIFGPSLEPVGPSRLAGLKGDVYFFLREDDAAVLWRSDGTREGTEKFFSFPEYRDGYLLWESEDAMFFITAFGLSYDQGGGVFYNTLWITDGTVEGTKNLDYGSAPFYSSSVPQGIRQPDPGSIDYHVIGREGAYYFVKSQRGLNRSNPRAELWCYKTGWPEPRLIHEVDDNYSIPLLAFDRGVLYYAIETQVWVTDGESAPTMMLEYFYSDIYLPGAVESVMGDSTFFIRHDREHGTELWIRDEEERMVKDIAPGVNSSHPAVLTPFKGMLYFTAWTWDNGRELWRSDGTEAGTQMVIDIAPGREDSSPTDLLIYDGYLYFMARGRELWRCDGTIEGTRRFIPSITWSAAEHANALWRKDRIDLNRKLGEPNIWDMISWKEKQYFVADYYTGEPRLYSTNGTPEGTEELFGRPAVRSIRSLIPLGEQLIFLVSSREETEEEVGDAVEYTLYQKSEIFRSDGTVKGTTSFLEWSRIDSEVMEIVDPDSLDLQLLLDQRHNIP